jgi:glycosyltransferase involved in cell wall biosynthesis
MKIGLDLRYLSHGITGGIATFLANLTPALFDVIGPDLLLLYADRKAPLRLPPLPAHVGLRMLPYHTKLSTVANDFVGLPKALARDGVHVAHFPANVGVPPAGTPAVLTLHDEINLLPLPEIWRGHRKSLYTLSTMTLLHFQSRIAVQRAQAVLTVSDHARKRIAHCAGIDPARIVVVPHGCPSDMHVINDHDRLDAVRRTLRLHRPFVLADGLKNPALLVHAWRRLPAQLREDHEIVFFARTPRVLPIVHEAIADGHARFLCRVERSTLCALFNMAHMFVFPSWIEGFGIPLLEAMACGTPIIASNRAAIPEVLGDAGMLGAVDDADALSAQLASLLTSEGRRSDLRTRGLARVRSYTWSSAAQQVVDVYRELGRVPRRWFVAQP